MFTLEMLDTIVEKRASTRDGTSYTASLVSKGVPVCARKLGEEAIETVIAALGGKREELVGEAADLLYHLLALLKAADIPLAEVMSELESRTAQSGLQEKAARKRSS